MNSNHPLESSKKMRSIIGDTDNIERIGKLYGAEYKIRDRRPVPLSSVIAMIDTRPKTTYKMLMTAFANAGYEVDKVVAPSRKTLVKNIRYALTYHLLYSVRPSMSLKEIGQVIGGRDHTTVMHARDLMKDLADTGQDGDIAVHINRIDKEIRELLRQKAEKDTSHQLPTSNPVNHAV